MTNLPESTGTDGRGVLLLGKGWYPDEIGGLDRFFRGLLEALPAARGVAEGPITHPHPQATTGGATTDPTPIRLLRFAASARRAGRGVTVVDSHFALTGFLPRIFLSRQRIHVTHFQGPWAYESAFETSTTGLLFHGRRLVERFVYRRADAVITLTHAFKRVAIEKYGLVPWKVHVIQPTVDVSDFTPGERHEERARLGLADAEFVTVCVRRLVPRTGVDDLLDAWKLVESDAPRRLLVAGDGQLRESIETRVSREPGLESVTVLGRIDNATLVSMYRAADLNVVPTRAWEGFGLTVKEAAACGTPSVVTNVGGLPEAVAPLGGGLVVPPEQPGELAQRITRAAQGDLPSRESVRDATAARTWTEVAGEHLALYERLRTLRGTGDKSRRPRVVYLDHTAALSGGELALLRILSAEESTVDAHVILAADGPLTERLTSASVSVEVLPLAERAQRMRKDAVGLRTDGIRAAISTLAYSARLAVRLRKISPDIVHCNSLKSGVYGSVAGRLAGVPVVWHVHDRITAGYLPGRVVPVLRFMMRRLPTTLVANAANVAATLGSPRPVPVIPNPVDPGLAPAHHRTPGFVFGVVGRLAEWKGQHVFLEAFATSYGGGETRARIIGSAMFGEEAYERRLRDLARDLGIKDQVEFVGFKSDVREELTSLDALVHCSVLPEPFGQVITEALAAGVPVIAADAGGPAELLSNNVDGLLTPPGDAAALARAMVRLSSDPDLRHRMSRAGLKTASGFSPSETWTCLDRVYGGLLDTPTKA